MSIMIELPLPRAGQMPCYGRSDKRCTDWSRHTCRWLLPDALSGDVCRWMLLLDWFRGLGIGRRTCWHWAHMDPNRSNTSSCMRTALHLIPHLCARSHQATWLYDAMLARSTGTRSPRESKASHPFSCTKLPTGQFGRTILPRVSTFVCLNRSHPLPFSRASHSIPHNHEFGELTFSR